MLRSILIYLSKAAWAQRIVTNWKFAWRAASRFIAGNTVEDAIQAVRTLNQAGINATLDHLGESTTTREEAARATDEVLALLEQISCCDVRANVSVKLTQIGLALDEAFCQANLEKLCACARRTNNFLRIDMEDTPYTDRTIRLFRSMQEMGFTNTGLVVQSYLYRTEKDVRELLAQGARFRLVKGAYKEPAEVAFPKKSDVDANFDALTRILVDAALAAGAEEISTDGRIPPVPALGTHDARRIDFACRYASSVGLSKRALEFQMLFGIRRDLQKQCVEAGYPVRVYVPYGTHWYPYYMRRMAERPANIWFFVSNFFRS